jgi:ferredoxin
MRITADPQACVGSGQCVLAAPAVFDQDDDGIVVLRTDHLDDRSAAARIHDAVALCPSRALSVRPDQHDPGGGARL